MEFKIQTEIDVSTFSIYEGWLDSQVHSEMTGSKAVITNELNASFTACDGYISGKNLFLIPDSFIRQSWRTTQFEAGQPDSIVEISIAPADSGKTLITLWHKNLTEKDMHYKNGWKEHYFKPMKEYFEG